MSFISELQQFLENIKATVTEFEEQLNNINPSDILWHYCENDVVRPYPQVLCSSCRAPDGSKTFKAIDEFNMLRATAAQADRLDNENYRLKNLVEDLESQLSRCLEGSNE